MGMNMTNKFVLISLKSRVTLKIIFISDNNETIRPVLNPALH